MKTCRTPGCNRKFKGSNTICGRCRWRKYNKSPKKLIKARGTQKDNWGRLTTFLRPYLSKIWKLK